MQQCGSLWRWGLITSRGQWFQGSSFPCPRNVYMAQVQPLKKKKKNSDDLLWGLLSEMALYLLKSKMLSDREESKIQIWAFLVFCLLYLFILSNPHLTFDYPGPGFQIPGHKTLFHFYWLLYLILHLLIFLILVLSLDPLVPNVCSYSLLEEVSF